MVRIDSFFSKKPVAKATPQDDEGPASHPADDDHGQDRKALRMERRELLYAVVRETMARVGILSSSYKYKVLSLDSRGNQYLIMMDLPRDMASQIHQLGTIEAMVKEKATQRHGIDVTAVYWRINELSQTAVLRQPRSEVAAPTRAAPADTWPVIGSSPRRQAAPAPAPADKARRFEPIRPDEVRAFKEGVKPGDKLSAKPTQPQRNDFAPTEFAPTDFQPTRLSEEDRMPLSRTQYGDLI